MSKEIEERLSEAVRKYPFLYDKTLVDFRDKRKKSLAWDDVNKETGLKSKCSSLLIINIFIHYSNNYLISHREHLYVYFGPIYRRKS